MPAEQEIQEIVEAARKEGYWFFTDALRGRFVRRRGADGPIDLLIDGKWVPIARQPLEGEPFAHTWRLLDDEELAEQVRWSMLENLSGRPLSWRRDFGLKLRRSPLWRWVYPPLDGGACRWLSDSAIVRSRCAYVELTETAKEPNLKELAEGATAGYQRQVDRIAKVEQRAAFFLGASGLTTSLVLANAGLLLGTGRLSSPWLQLGASALVISSICAIVSGLRAIQLSTRTFSRVAMNATGLLRERSHLSGEAVPRAYLGSSLAAQNREWLIADWKVSRLGSVRRWFLGVLGGVVLLTLFVLVEALST